MNFAGRLKIEQFARNNIYVSYSQEWFVFGGYNRGVDDIECTSWLGILESAAIV